MNREVEIFPPGCVGLVGLANKDTECLVKFEFQISTFFFLFFSISMSQMLHGI